MAKLNKYEIEKDRIFGEWIVWEIHLNYKKAIYQAKTREACQNWLDTIKKKG